MAATDTSRRTGTGAARLSGWIGNRADSPTELEITDELAAEFIRSSYYEPDGLLSRQLPLWLAAADGRNIAWEPREPANAAALDELWERVRRLEEGA